jgi:diguanylate cyclase (GGDEF)-like protein
MARDADTTASSWFGSLMRWMSDPAHEGVILVVSVGALVVVGFADRATGPYVSMSLFYILPVMAVAWSNGRSRGALLAVLAVSISFAVTLSQPVGPTLGNAIWNAGSRLVFDLLIVWLVSSQRRLMRRLRVWATEDDMTATLNRRAFYRDANRTHRSAARASRAVTTLFIDVDGLKAVNDAQGHGKGDDMIVEVARALRMHVRGEADLIGRVGGDEFVVWMPGVPCRRGIEVAERVVSSLRRSGGVPIRVSIGIASDRADLRSVEELVTAADEAMYDAKRSGIAIRVAPHAEQLARDCA